MTESKGQTFRDAGESRQPSLLREIMQMLGQNKKYWMIPIIVVLVGFGLLLAVGGSAAAPFIYQLF